MRIHSEKIAAQIGEAFGMALFHSYPIEHWEPWEKGKPCLDAVELEESDTVAAMLDEWFAQKYGAFGENGEWDECKPYHAYFSAVYRTMNREYEKAKQ